MNCHTVQRQLLAALHPERPSAEAAAHLAECPDCRAWQERLVGIERQVPLVPVPRSREGKRELFRKLHAGKGGEWESPREAGVPCSHTHDPSASHSSTIPLHHALTLVAAGLLLVVCGWWLFRGSPTPGTARASRPMPPADPLLAQLLENNVRLSQALTPRERVEEVARIVDHLHDHTQGLVLVADAALLQGRARLYEKIVHDAVVPGASQVAPAQRRAVLAPLADQLARVGDQAEQWAQEAGPSSAAPLRQIAAAARSGTGRLRLLLQEGNAATRPALLGLLGLTVVALEPAAPPADELAQLQRNQALIEALVDGSVRLVRDEDPLARAEACAKVARQFALEIQQAAADHDAARAAELGAHLHKLLEQGVASNLLAARKQIPQGSTAQTKLREVSEQAHALLQPFRKSLAHAAAAEEPGEVHAVLEDLLRKQADLERALPPAAATTPY